MRGEAVTGFGHRVYRTEDPRARHMREGVEELSSEVGEPKWFNILQAVVEAMKPYARFGVNVNVDFYSGVIYYLNGIPADLFVPIFAAAECLAGSFNAWSSSARTFSFVPSRSTAALPHAPYVPITQR